MNKSHIFTVTESNGIDRAREPVQLGIPLPLGEYRSIDSFTLCTEDDELLPSAKTVTARWHDKSIKWCLFNFDVSLQAGQSQKVFLLRRDAPAPKNEQSSITDTQSTLTVKTRNAEFSLGKERAGVFTSLAYAGDSVSSASDLLFTFEGGVSATAEIEQADTRVRYAEDGPSVTEVVLRSSVTASNGRGQLRVRQEWLFYHAADTARCLVTVHNPAAAIHAGGHWDLGDPNSVMLKALKLGQTLQNPPQSVLVQAELDDDWQQLEAKQMELYQESSGGEHWNSPVHLNRDGRVALEHKGYRLGFDAKIVSGDRASPVISIETAEKHYLNARVRRFWQNFPKSIGFDHRELSIELLPQQFPDLHEIQPGEKKTHEIVFSLAEEPQDLAWVERPLAPDLNLDWLRHTKVLPEIGELERDDRLDAIIQLGLDGEENFFAKREAIDEYGWRNFGDIYADHETLEYQGDDLFVSHYNNQYDPLLGFLYRYLVSGDARWFELADDLARHISDIDIYDTDRDRAEYNHGLFWHTDHYVPATTATHRTYSKNQPKNVYQDHISGGGPGGQHCYTSGLALHYLLTGYRQSMNSVEQIADWIGNYYEGSATIADTLLAVKNRKRKDIKNIFTGKYPLDRGTGNYINALLDLYSLKTSQSLLDRAGLIIKQTAGPQDDIDERNLLDVENAWFYTVFLQALIRFLLAKENSAQLDTTFYHARDILLHYADWMVEHEYPYLEKPEILEYPNVTWIAQDVRKAHIFCWAAYFSPTPRPEYIERFDFFMHYVASTLIKEHGHSHTRILSILMQNLVPQISGMHDRAELPDFRPLSGRVEHSKRAFAATLWSAVKRVDIRTELNWLSRRSTIAQKLIDRVKPK